MMRRHAVVVACAIFLALAMTFSDSIIDDAYIVFRYADNLVAGHGPVFNPGERVEGFTSPLWLGLVALARAAGVPGERAVTVMGAAFGVAAILATWALARRVAPGWPAVAAAVLLALDPAHAMWSVHGLETALAVALVALSFNAWGGPARTSAWIAGVLFGLLAWTRPEAPLLVAVIVACALVRGDRERTPRLVAGFAAVFLPLLMLRASYYGTLLPNTFFAKTGGGAGRIAWGIGEARRFVVAHLPLVLACAAAALVARARRAPPLVVDAIACGVAWSAWVVWIGGDAFPGYRFWLPVLPLAGLVGAWALAEGIRARPALAGAAAAITISWVAVGAWPEALREAVTGKEFTGRMKAAGAWLHDYAPREATIALNYAGAVPYVSGLRTIDMLGLTDPAIARTPIRGRFRYPGHARANGPSVLDRSPELVLMGGVHLAREPVAVVPAELDTEEQIARDPRFGALYEQVQVEIPTPEGTRWFVFCKLKSLAWVPAGARVTPLPEE
jgi:hypothetical protein